MLYFLYFIIYSFIGFVLETLYTLFTTNILVMKKCFLFNFLCPVYGIGALVILGATKYFRDNKLLTIIVGGIAATVVEYFIHFIYKDMLGVTIWSYDGYKFNIQGRICMLFTFFWSFLSYFLVYFIHPFIEKNMPPIPKSVALSLLIFVGIDSILSIFLYKFYGTKDAVNIFWLTSIYRKTH